MTPTPRIIIIGGSILVGLLLLEKKSSRVSASKPASTLPDDVPYSPPVPPPPTRKGETAFAVPEARYTEQKTSGWEKTGRSVLYVPPVQASGKTVGTYYSNPKTAGEFFKLYGSPSLYWADLGQWEWSNAPLNLIQMDQDRRAFAVRTPAYS